MASVVPAYGGQPIDLTLADAISLALQENRTLQASQADVEAAAAERRAALGRFGPVLKMEGNLLQWNDAHEIDVFDYLELPPTAAEIVDFMVGPMDPIALREDRTHSLSLTAIQPLTPMFSVYQGYRARRAGENAAQALESRTRQDVTYKVVEAYYRLLSVGQLRQVAQAATDTIAAHVEQARDFEAEGFIDRSQVLTAEVELSNSQQNLLRAETGEALARAALAQLVGLPLDAEIRAAADLPAPGDPTPPELAAARREALYNREDLQALGWKIEALRALEDLGWWQMVPTLALVGRYEWSEGIILYPEEESFIGLTLEWNFWEWGRKYNEAQAARARARGAALQHAEATELIQLQVQQKRQELQCAGARQRVAEIAVSQAEENLRLKQLRFAENLATSLEVLDAQTLLTKAHSDRIQARFEVLVGQAALRLAMGQDPAGGEGSEGE